MFLCTPQPVADMSQALFEELWSGFERRATGVDAGPSINGDDDEDSAPHDVAVAVAATESATESASSAMEVSADKAAETSSDDPAPQESAPADDNSSTATATAAETVISCTPTTTAGYALLKKMSCPSIYI